MNKEKLEQLKMDFLKESQQSSGVIQEIYYNLYKLLEAILEWEVIGNIYENKDLLK